MKYIIITIFTTIFLGECIIAQTNTDLPLNTNINTTRTNFHPAISTAIITTIDLTQVVDDKVPVTINPGKFSQDTVTYRLPKVVQGTYKVSNFGSFVESFKAYDYKGEEMEFNKIDINSWVITNATELDKITYLVNDTFDIESAGIIPTPFSPSGTNIDIDIYVLNLHGFIGYFDSLKSNQYKLDVTSPVTFKRSSALQNAGIQISEDGLNITTSYFAPRYFDITDNPMMYGNLDVEEFQVGDIKIVLSVYSPNEVHTAKDLKETMLTMMEAQKAYLGDVDSTPRYDIFVYLSELKETSPTGFGALEHHTSTVVVMPESMPKEALAKSMIGIVSHEFFHIVTPLSVHSEDIHYFDYNNPTFSKHLWMYEGVTEYFATLFQVNQGLVSEEEFYNTLMGKIQTASSLDDTMSFTEMSENILESPYAENYYNVYQKGALIGMCIDILLREESNGSRGILSLMKELSLKFGKNIPFEDDLLIDEIVSMTYPSLRIFFDTHVIGTTPISYDTFFEKVGLEISESTIETNYIQNNGVVIVEATEEDTIIFNDLVADNSFWNDQGVLPNDIIIEINGNVLTVQNAHQVFTEVFMWQPGSEVVVKLKRGEEEININTTLTQSYTSGNGLMPIENATNEQIALQNAWLKG
ncbi:MAG: peptidase M61 [Bacteroidetes bacterium]|nr:peptidase M61 [Bacteroidota bacterium]